METWTAGQIGSSLGAHSGRRVQFTTQGIDVDGRLDQSFAVIAGPDPSDFTHLIVDGTTHVVWNTTVVSVHDRVA